MPLLILLMMSRAALGVDSNPIMRIFSSRCTLLRIVKLCFLVKPLIQIVAAYGWSENSCTYPFHGLRSELPCWSNSSPALHEYAFDFFTLIFMCSFHVGLLSGVTPRNLVVLRISISVPFTARENSLSSSK